MRIGLTGIFVDDQDQAERFYTDVLGLHVKTNAAYGPGERWLTVVSPEEPDGVELVLHLADEPARAFQAAIRRLGDAYARLQAWLKEHGHQPASPGWEVYHWIDLDQEPDPTRWPDQSTWRTQLVQPIR